MLSLKATCYVLRIPHDVVVPNQAYEIREQMLVDESNRAFKQTVSWPMNCIVLTPVLDSIPQSSKTGRPNQNTI